MNAGIHCLEDGSFFLWGGLGKLEYFGLYIRLSLKLTRNALMDRFASGSAD